MKTFFTVSVRLCIILLLISAVGCNKTKPRVEGKRSFCYWNRSYHLPDTSLWNQLQADHLYIRYFDVDWDRNTHEAKPVATLQEGYDSFPKHFTPSVFLTNNVFEKSSSEQLDSLSQRIKRRIEYITERFALTSFYKSESFKNNYDYSRIDSARSIYANRYKQRYSDILIDCDWTEKTKDSFFYFVNRLKKDFPDKEITVTLRLWQYNQQKTAGIPPVKRCLLMCYNMQSPEDYRTENSIGSLEELKKYVSKDNYPLSLDIALPIFNWAVLFRNERFVGLLGNVYPDTYENNFIEYKKTGNKHYQLLTDKVIGNFFARKGDVVRVENVDPDELLAMAKHLSSTLSGNKIGRITLFSWNTSYIHNYGTNQIENVYSAFSK